MLRLAAPRPLTAWLAMLAVLLMSLAPTVSHALGRASGEVWMEVCSAEGSRWVQAESSDPGGALGAAASLLDHCPCCASHTPALGLPPVPHPAALDAGLSDDIPQAVAAAPRPSSAWVRAQSRAPPLRS